MFTKKSRKSPRSYKRNPSEEEIQRARLRAKLDVLKAEREKQRRAQKKAAQKRRGIKRTLTYRELEYQKKLKTVRTFIEGFDAKRFEPKAVVRLAEKGTQKRVAQKKARGQVNRRYKKLEPLVRERHKVVRSKSAVNLEKIREYAAAPKMKRLKAVPVRTIGDPDNVTVRVDRKGRVEKKERILGQVFREKLYIFDRKPRNPDDMETMAKALIKRVPDGFYIVITDTHDLIPSVRSRGLLLDEIRRLSYPYRSQDDPSPEGEAKRFRGFVSRIRGFKWLGSFVENAGRFQSEIARRREEWTAQGRNVHLEHDARVRKLIAKRRSRPTERMRKRGRR